MSKYFKVSDENYRKTETILKRNGITIEGEYMYAIEPYIEQEASYQLEEYKKNNFTIDIENGVDSLWDAIHSGYQDFEGDAIKRDSVGAVNGLRYTDNSARNDIKLVKVTNGVKNIYFYIECKEDITTYNGTDENYMNIWLRTNSKDPSFNGFNILINRNIKNNEGTIEK